MQQLGTHQAYVVGLRYHAGARRPAPGERVRLVREPANTSDANAIAAYNRANERVGYLSALLARLFAPLMDRGHVTLKATAQEWQKGMASRDYYLPIEISAHGEGVEAAHAWRAAMRKAQKFTPCGSLLKVKREDGRYDLILKFGKYKDLDVIEVSTFDPGYIRWLLQNTECSLVRAWIKDAVIRSSQEQQAPLAAA